MPDSSEEKTEKATPKKRSDQRKEGNIFQSKEVIIAFSLIVSFFAFRLLYSLIEGTLEGALRTYFNAAGTMKNDIPGGGFSSKYIDASSIQVKAVYYNKGTSSSVDYSKGETNDDNTGGSGGSGGTSSGDTTTNKDLDVEFNYAKALQESLYFYDANMCGNLEGTCTLSWRGNCHTYDKNVTYIKNGKTYNVDASGGFHDAGDHVKFGLPQGYAASMLGMSYYQFKDAFDELGQKEHLKKITDYFCDYFKRCTVYEGDQVIAFCYQVGDGNTCLLYTSPSPRDA